MDKKTIEDAYERFGSERRAAKHIGISKSHFHRLRRRYNIASSSNNDRLVLHKTTPYAEKVGKERLIFTSAQNNTGVDPVVWSNIIALSKHYKAKILVSGFTYNHNAYGELSVKKGTKKDQDRIWYDKNILPYMSDKSIMISPDLLWNGELNVSPTTTNPTTGMHNYCGERSGIIPHAKVRLTSLPSHKTRPARMLYTTGCCTVKNYIQMKAGLKAEKEHDLGCLIVEVDHDTGDWFVRQVQANHNGDLSDIGITVSNGNVIHDDNVKVITWGDIHTRNIDKIVKKACFSGEESMLDTLNPQYQIMHDVLDFQSQNHHDRKDPHKRFKKHINGHDNVEDEVKEVADFIDYTHRKGCESVIIDSNHDNALTRWLKETDYRSDPENALFFLRSQTKVYESILNQDDNFHLLESVIRDFTKKGTFIRQDQSYQIDGIEYGCHGHLGANGARGTPTGLAKLGKSMVTAHTHAAGIYGALYVAGTSTKLDLGYNSGFGAWSHSHVITYNNGMRCIITMRGERWRI